MSNNDKKGETFLNDFSKTDAVRAFELAYHLAARAIIEFTRPPERPGPALEVGHAMTLVEAGGAAYDAGDARGAIDAVQGALRALAAARAGAPKGPARGDRAIDLVDQTSRALERAEHRLSNTRSSRMVFGAIETPRSERLP